MKQFQTESDVQAYLDEHRRKMNPGLKVDPRESDPGPESDLQRKCETWLNDNGFPFLHDRSRKKNTPGRFLDLHIYLKKGRHVVIELKVKGNKLSKEQERTKLQLMQLGFEVHEVRSYKRFLEVVKCH